MHSKRSALCSVLSDRYSTRLAGIIGLLLVLLALPLILVANPVV